MVKRNLLSSNVSQLLQVYKKKFPYLVTMAKSSGDVIEFKESLRNYLNRMVTGQEETCPDRKKAAEQILRMVDFDGRTVDELSTGKQISITSISCLWDFLCETNIYHISPDLILDFYYQFELLEHGVPGRPGRIEVKRQMNRWPTGLDSEVIEIRQKNRERIIDCLIKKIDKRHGSSSKYQFPEGSSYEEKRRQVEDWWNSSRFHLAMAIKSPGELNAFLGYTLSEETMQLLLRAKKKQMPFFITPYYLSLLNPGDSGYDDTTIRTYVLYSNELVDTYGKIRAWEKEDQVIPGQPNAAGWILPEGNNIHRRYPEVAILIPDSMGRACGGLCASCQRMYDFQSERLNFDLEALKPKESWDKKLRRLMFYFEQDTQLRDILITGGDALMSQNATLRRILEAVYKMALRKKKANELRPPGEKYAELLRVRLGSRLLAYLPARVTSELVQILKEFKEKASAIGVQQFYIQTHFQSPLEVTPEAKQAIQAIQEAGWTVTNQLVFTVAASRRGHTAKLRQTLNSVGVVCYYTFSVKGFQENYAMFTPNSRSLQESQEEKMYGLVPLEKQDELYELIRNKRPLGKNLTRFLKENGLLFAGTDRNVLNLPAIGKSMTFTTVGLTPDGKRILQFEHDASRRHSPVIDKMAQVFIVENKSVGAYLRQLTKMGEDISEYRTIWHYMEGKTEPRFSLYEYPSYTFDLADVMTNYEDPYVNDIA